MFVNEPQTLKHRGVDPLPVRIRIDEAFICRLAVHLEEEIIPDILERLRNEDHADVLYSIVELVEGEKFEEKGVKVGVVLGALITLILTGQPSKSFMVV